jgi:hypothetical protein
MVSFVAFHERGFSVPTGQFIRGVLFEYGLQLQHLNPNSIQQMAGDVQGVPRNQCPSTPLPVLLQVHLLEGWLLSGDDRLRQPSDEAGPG